jgi:outer membrane lipoprotein-sorting protein
MQGQKSTGMMQQLNTGFVLTILFSTSGVAWASDQGNANSGIVQSKLMKSNYTDGSQFINKMCSAADAMDSYSSNYQMSVNKKRPPVTQAGTLAFRKPRLMRVQVTSGKNNGSLAILQDDGKVHGRPGGALNVFKGSVSPDSPKVKAPNGIRMVDTDFSSLASYLRNMLGKGKRSRLSSQPIQTDKSISPTFVLDVYSGRPEHEHLVKRIYTDPTTFLPVFWEDYRHDKLYSESSWSDLKTNVSFPANFFTL